MLCGVAVPTFRSRHQLETAVTVEQRTSVRAVAVVRGRRRALGNEGAAIALRLQLRPQEIVCSTTVDEIVSLHCRYIEGSQ